VLWTDGGSPIKTKKGTALAKPGERIDLWEDRERNFGANHIHYIFSKTPPKQEKLPILAIVENQFGLKGSFPVVRFQGDQNLLMATDDTPATATDILANLKLFESERFGICIVFRASSPEKGELISCNTSTTANGKIWEIRTDEGKLELSATGKAVLPLPDPIGFNFVLIDRSNKENTMRFFLAGAEKDWKVSPVLKNQPLGSPINRVRLGSRAASSTAGPATPNFQGDIAEILVYTVHISESQREEILGYLRAKYFGLPGKP
jgi:hypothetical protein